MTTTWTDLRARADRLAETDMTLRAALREVRSSRWCTLILNGSYRGPSFRELEQMVEAAEAAIARAS